MKQEPINPDNPDLTAYALGELSPGEKREFESKLESSPAAQAELESLDEIMSMLSRGLKEELSAVASEPSLSALPSSQHSEAETKTVVGSFGPRRRAFGAVTAAAAAVALLAVGLVAFKEVPAGIEFASVSSVDRELSIPGISVPQLVLSNEVEDMGGLSLSEAIRNLETMASPVDATYLEADAVVPASIASVSAQAAAAPSRVARVGSKRVDSYLPPVLVEESEQTGLIERRVQSAPRFAVNGEGNSRVLVRGYIPFEEMESEDSSVGKVLVGFKPVAMSGNPVRGEQDLRYMAELQAIQKEISAIAGRLPEGSAERQDLNQLLDRNRTAIEGLKAQFSQ